MIVIVGTGICEYKIKMPQDKHHDDIVPDSQKSSIRSENRKIFKSKPLTRSDGVISPPDCCGPAPIIRPVPVHATKNFTNVTVCEYIQPPDSISYVWGKGEYCDSVETCHPQHKLHNDPSKSAFKPGMKTDKEKSDEDLYELSQNVHEVAVTPTSVAHDKACSSEADNYRLGHIERQGLNTNHGKNILMPQNQKPETDTPMLGLKDLTNNYEEPWDTGSQQKFFSAMFQNADKDQTSAEIIFRENREESPSKYQLEQNKNTSNIKSCGNFDGQEVQILNDVLEEKPSNNGDAGLTLNKPEIKDEFATYEEPWDSALRQQQFEEKLVGMNLSQKPGQKNSDDQTVRKVSSCDKESHLIGEPVDVMLDSLSSRAGKSPGPKTSYQPNYDEPWDTRTDFLPFSEHLSVVESHKKTKAPAEVPSLLTSKDCMPNSPTTEVPSLPTSRGSTPIYLTARWHGPLVERIDSSVPLYKQQFFHRQLSRDQADELVVRHRPGSYLIRRSETQQDGYSLSIKGATGSPMHLRITNVNDKYILGENSIPFNSIPHMLDFYATHHLPIRNMEKIYLTHPIQ